MLENLLARLYRTNPPETPMPPADAQRALGALLVRAAKADKTYLLSEIHEIDHLLADLYALNPVKAARLRRGPARPGLSGAALGGLALRPARRISGA
jgi:uncharacterized tellurite resistance protein B-like protein